MDYQIESLADGSYRFVAHQAFEFHQGGEIKPLVLVYETYGKLNADQSNAVLIHHAISTNAHLASTPQNPEVGWWEAMVGPGKAIDTDQYFVICINNLGSCFGSSGPASVNPATGKAYRTDFPTLSIDDIVRSQQVLLEALGIKKLHAVIGNSMGGMLSIRFAILYPNHLKKLISVSSCFRAYPVSIGYHDIQKAVIALDPDFHQGRYEKNPMLGLKLARKIGLISYRDAEDLNYRFLETEDIREYLEYNANKLAAKFDANCYIYLLDAMDSFHAADGFMSEDSAFAAIKAESLVISVDSDVLFPPMQQQELHANLYQNNPKAQYMSLASNYGHDAFYADRRIGEQIKIFLNRD